MNNEKKISKWWYVVIITAIVAVLSCCVVFFHNQGNESSHKSDTTISTSGNFLFSYGDEIDIVLGEKFDLSPCMKSEGNVVLTYAHNNQIVNISANGILETKQVGQTEIVIKNHNISIKTVKNTSTNWKENYRKFTVIRPHV